MFLVVFQTYFVKLYKTEVENSLQQSCAQAGNTLDWQFQQLGNIAAQVRLSDQFRAAYAEDPVHQVEMHRQLHMLQSSNQFLFDINFYQKNIPVVISSRCVMQKNTIGRIHFSYPQWPLDQMLEDLNQLSAAQCRTFEPMRSLNRSDLEIMTISIPLSVPEEYNARVLQFQIEKGDFEEAIGLTGQEGSIFVIVNRKGELVYAPDGLTDACAELARSVSFTGTESTGGDGFLAIGQPSQVQGWYYVTLLPVREAMAKSNWLRLFCFAYAEVLLVLSLLVIFWISRRNYRPIQRLNELANRPPVMGMTRFSRHSLRFFTCTSWATT